MGRERLCQIREKEEAAGLEVRERIVERERGVLRKRKAKEEL